MPVTFPPTEVTPTDADGGDGALPISKFTFLKSLGHVINNYHVIIILGVLLQMQSTILQKMNFAKSHSQFCLKFFVQKPWKIKPRRMI